LAKRLSSGPNIHSVHSLLLSSHPLDPLHRAKR
jgi:hypothetical protein